LKNIKKIDNIEKYKKNENHKNENHKNENRKNRNCKKSDYSSDSFWF